MQFSKFFRIFVILRNEESSQSLSSKYFTFIRASCGVSSCVGMTSWVDKLTENTTVIQSKFYKILPHFCHSEERRIFANLILKVFHIHCRATCGVSSYVGMTNWMDKVVEIQSLYNAILKVFPHFCHSEERRIFAIFMLKVFSHSLWSFLWSFLLRRNDKLDE